MQKEHFQIRGWILLVGKMCTFNEELTIISKKRDRPTAKIAIDH